MALNVDGLQNGQAVTYRTGKAGDTAPEWSEWRQGTVYVQRHNGKITVIALNDVNWAEYRASDYDPTFNTFLTEDYYLEIKEDV